MLVRVNAREGLDVAPALDVRVSVVSAVV